MIPLNHDLEPLRRSGIRLYTNMAKEVPGCVMLTLGEPDFPTPQPIREQYEIYLRRRVRPTLEALIAAEDMARLEALEAQGWLDAALTEDGLKFAVKEKKTEPFVWLLGKKAEKYGFSDWEFQL